ncbi:monovalent cation/H+ antiporter complex subunit F [Mucisphaera calidilacus]|uniref:Na(+)/H(+) antiporter subunit F1 n=1 Tax=Mucisphaera calidilacus TaxID=2527982 RepID=A0A518BX82_9BACT|nr:monovalent cation/H+ antiporter complex subunit F [Mucisphaera calidilacus]QDU71573.1 Na(+)/H(+) antiporter subunit F1 [Mucisphaera calidilacus]
MNHLTPLILAAAKPDAHAEPGLNEHALPEHLTFLDPVIEVVLIIGLVLVVAGVILCLYRIVKGPHLADRVLAADALGLQVVGLVLVLAIATRIDAFFDTALTVAIIGFASTVAFGQYIGANAPKPEETDENENQVTS